MFVHCFRNDAMMMQLLQSSHHAVEIYGHCSGTVITESAVEDLSDRIVPYGGYMPEEGLYDEDDVNPLNNLTIAEKLDIALEMAECLGDMHGKQRLKINVLLLFLYSFVQFMKALMVVFWFMTMFKWLSFGVARMDI